MACLFIVDDDAVNARQLADVIRHELRGADDIICLQGLADFRRQRRRHRPALILVELMRYQSNGFTLAATLTRLSSVPVVLLTDRDLASDRLWAVARGIRHVISRRCGRVALTRQLNQLMDSGSVAHSDSAQQTSNVPVEGWISPEEAVLRQARQHRQSQSESDPARVLLAQCKQCWSEIGRQVQPDPAAAIKFCHKLLNALRFLPVSGAAATELELETGIGLPVLLERVQEQLGRAETCDGLQALISTVCRRVLQTCSNGGPARRIKGWRELSGLFLMLRTLSAPAQWQLTLQTCLMGLYGWPYNTAEANEQQLFSLTMALLDDHLIKSNLIKNNPDQGSVAAAEPPPLTAEAAQKLEQALTRMAAVLAAEQPRQHLSELMVSVYKLRSYFEAVFAEPIAEAQPGLRWCLLINSFYSILCHALLQPAVVSGADICTLSKSVDELLHSVRQGSQPSDKLVMDLAALDICLIARMPDGFGREHQLLAAGLHRLPKPDAILSALQHDVKHSGSALSEMTHELALLAEGAQRLGVARVESLATLLLDCYRQLNRQPELLQRKSLRLALGRAHRVLCRLLDQAAAWLPLDSPDTGLAVSAVIDGLFNQFDHTALLTAESGAVAVDTEVMQAVLAQCQSLNRRLRQLLRKSGNLSEYRSLLQELLREQQAVITRYLRYQSSD